MFENLMGEMVNILFNDKLCAMRNWLNKLYNSRFDFFIFNINYYKYHLGRVIIHQRSQ